MQLRDDIDAEDTFPAADTDEGLNPPGVEEKAEKESGDVSDSYHESEESSDGSEAWWLKQPNVEIGILSNLAPPHSPWVQHRCGKHKSQVCNSFSDIM